jgi:hypothetical protein
MKKQVWKTEEKEQDISWNSKELFDKHIFGNTWWLLDVTVGQNINQWCIEVLS